MKRYSVPRLAAAAFAATFLTSTPVWAQATDVVCDECVGSSDLAPNAVSNSKIGNGAVNAAKLGANAVTVAKIANNSITTSKLTTAAVTAAKLGPNSVNAAKIANAAVTSAKLAPDAVNQLKIAPGAVVGDKIADGAVSAAKLGIANTVFVEDSGDNVLNCTNLMDALAAATAPDAVVLGPAVFGCGTNLVSVPAGVSLIGTSRSATTISGIRSGEQVELMPGSILRSLRVLNNAPAIDSPTAVLANGPGTIIDDVTARAPNGTKFSYGVSTVGNVRITNSRVFGGNAGVFQETTGTAEIHNSIVDGGSFAILGALNPIHVISSGLSGASIFANATLPFCVGSYDRDAEVPLDNICVPILMP